MRCDAESDIRLPDLKLVDYYASLVRGTVYLNVTHERTSQIAPRYDIKLSWNVLGLG